MPTPQHQTKAPEAAQAFTEASGTPSSSQRALVKTIIGRSGALREMHRSANTLWARPVLQRTTLQSFHLLSSCHL